MSMQCSTLALYGTWRRRQPRAGFLEEHDSTAGRYKSPSLLSVEVPLFDGALTAPTPLYAAPSRSFPVIRRLLTIMSGDVRYCGRIAGTGRTFHPLSVTEEVPSLDSIIYDVVFYCGTLSIDSRLAQRTRCFPSRKREESPEDRILNGRQDGLAWNERVKGIFFYFFKKKRSGKIGRMLYITNVYDGRCCPLCRVCGGLGAVLDAKETGVCLAVVSSAWLI
ncbi:hypothetical protein J3F83DRAFT_406529 [Trichoderma novae-zelandiae]